jgi:hypothetical protein
MNTIFSKNTDGSSNDDNDSLYCLECGKPYYTALYPDTPGGGMCECTDEIAELDLKED